MGDVIAKINTREVCLELAAAHERLAATLRNERSWSSQAPYKRGATIASYYVEEMPELGEFRFCLLPDSRIWRPFIKSKVFQRSIGEKLELLGRAA